MANKPSNGSETLAVSSSINEKLTLLSPSNYHVLSGGLAVNAKKVAALTSFNALVNQLLNARLLTLRRTEGYLIPHGVISRLVAIIAPPGTALTFHSLLMNLVVVRDIFQFAADIMGQMTTAQTFRHVMTRQEVVDFVTTNAATLAPHVNSTYFDIVAHLIVAAEYEDAQFMLVRPTSTNQNLFDVFTTLYQSVVDDAHVFVYSHDAQAVIAAADHQTMYLDPTGATFQAETLRVNAILTLDHVLTLLTSASVWKMFVSPKSGTSDSNQNIERLKSLKAGAAYFHSLLALFPFVQNQMTYNLIELLCEFSGFPTGISPQVQAVQDETIKTYDVLGVQHTVKAIFANLRIEKGSDALANSSSALLLFPTEFLQPSGLTHLQALMATANASVAAASALTSETLSAISNTMVSHAIHGMAINDIGTLQQIGEASVLGLYYNNALNAALLNIQGICRPFMSASVITFLRATTWTPYFSWHAPHFFDRSVTKATPYLAESAKFKWAPNTLRYSEIASRIVQEQTQLRVTSEYGVANVVSAEPTISALSTVYIDVEIADMYATLQIEGDQPSQALLPSSLTPSSETIERVVLTTKYYTFSLNGPSSPLETVLEHITRIPVQQLRRSIRHNYVRELIATHISSFGLLYFLPDNHAQYIDPAGVSDVFAVSSTVSTLSNPTLNPVDDRLAAAIASGGMVLQPGKYYPYGVEYTTLASMQAGRHDAVNYVQIGMNEYILVLDTFPIPRAADPTQVFVDISSRRMLRRQVTSGGTGAELTITRFSYAQPWYHCALFAIPFPAGWEPMPLSFTNRFIIPRLSVGINSSTARYFKFKERSSDLDIQVVVKPWEGTVYQAFIRWVVPIGGYQPSSTSTTGLESEKGKPGLLGDFLADLKQVEKQVDDERVSAVSPLITASKQVTSTLHASVKDAADQLNADSVTVESRSAATEKGGSGTSKSKSKRSSGAKNHRK